MSYDHVTRDLCRKASADIQASIKRTGSLLADPADQMMVAVYAAGTALAAATGYATALIARDTGQTPEPAEVLTALWEMIQPVALKSAGGDDKPYRDLLAATSLARENGGAK